MLGGIGSVFWGGIVECVRSVRNVLGGIGSVLGVLGMCSGV